MISPSPPPPPPPPLPYRSRLRPSLCGSCIIRLSLLNPRSNLKSEEKLDSLIGRERKSRLGRREPLIKSYRLSSPFTLPKSPDRKFSPWRSRRLSSFLLCPPRYSIHFFFPPSYRREVLNDPRWFCRLISHPLLICFNYTVHLTSPLIRQLSRAKLPLLVVSSTVYFLIFIRNIIRIMYWNKSDVQILINQSRIDEN